MTHSTTELYRHYKDKGGNLSRSLFRQIICSYNEMVMDEIIYNGYDLNLSNNLANLSVSVVKRNYSSKAIDWNSTREYKKELISEGISLYSKDNPEGQKYFVYFINDFYVQFHWEKKNCKIPNKMAYSFDATRGLKGNKTKLKDLLNSDPLAYLKYRCIGDS